MKKISIVFIIFLSVLSTSFGQVKLGWKAGMNFSKVKSTAPNNFTYNTSFNSGLAANFKLAKKFLIDAECILSVKGFNSVLTPNGKIVTRLYYLTAPVLLEYKASGKIYFQIGPELNLLVGSKMKNKSANISVADNYKNFDITLAGGLGYSISKNVKLETRYSYGLSQIRKTPEIFGSQYNRTFQLNLIYFFR